ncbi:hypothetical protein GCM10010451_07760 [Streptomyces virens]
MRPVSADRPSCVRQLGVRQSGGGTTRVAAMSVNLRIELDVRGLVSREQAEEVRSAVHEVIRDERIDNEVTLSLREHDGEHMVLGRTGHYPVIISGVRHWEPEFKRGLEVAVREVAPEAYVRLLCVDVDLERAIEAGTI